MSIDHAAILGVGKWFESSDDAFEWLKQQDDFLDENDVETISKNGLEDCLGELDLQGGHLNYYNAYGFYIGFDLDADNLSCSYISAKSNWGSMFKEDPKVILEVRVS